MEWNGNDDTKHGLMTELTGLYDGEVGSTVFYFFGAGPISGLFLWWTWSHISDRLLCDISVNQGQGKEGITGFAQIE